MGAIRVRLLGWLETLAASLWLVPTAAILGALLTASLLVNLEPLPEWLETDWFFTGSSESARSLLSALATSTVTVVGLVFSLTVIALQMASSQFSPRLLRSFLADRGVQIVLSGMLASAVFDVAVLRTVRSEDGELSAFVPRMAVSIAMLVALFAVGLLVYFLHHVTRMLRVDVLMGQIASTTIAQAASLAAPREVLPDQVGPEPPADAVVVAALRSGYVQRVDADSLASGARRLTATVRLRPVMGEWVTSGTTLAWVWGDEGSRDLSADAAADLVHDHVHLGPDRTESGDLAWGIRQLQDIAVRSLSPGVNDPTTAVQAIGQMAVVMSDLAGQPLGADVRDSGGRPRAIAPRPTFAGHLELAVGQARRNARQEPDVLIALLRMLTDVGEQVVDSADRSAVVHAQIDRVDAAADLDDPDDLARVRDAADFARRTLDQGTRPVPTSDAG